MKKFIIVALIAVAMLSMFVACEDTDVYVKFVDENKDGYGTVVVPITTLQTNTLAGIAQMFGVGAASTEGVNSSLSSFFTFDGTIDAGGYVAASVSGTLSNVTVTISFNSSNLQTITEALKNILTMYGD